MKQTGDKKEARLSMRISIEADNALEEIVKEYNDNDNITEVISKGYLIRKAIDRFIELHKRNDKYILQAIYMFDWGELVGLRLWNEDNLKKVVSEEEFKDMMMKMELDGVYTASNSGVRYEYKITSDDEAQEVIKEYYDNLSQNKFGVPIEVVDNVTIENMLNDREP